MTFLYDVFYIILAVLYFPYLALKGKAHPGFSMRFGKFSKALKKSLGEKENIWIHAVSVGEVLAVQKVIGFLKDKFPFYQIVISTVTPTGYALAHKTFSDTIVIFAPLDFSWAVRRYLRVIEPRVYVAVETEIWPNLFSMLHERQIPVLLVNGRISDKSFGKYQMARPLLQNALKSVDVFLMQGERDAERIKNLGARPDKIMVVGNLKFDDVESVHGACPENLGFSASEPCLVAGSTHPGEEEIMLRIYSALRKDFPGLKLVLAPRHIERSEEVFRLAEAQNLSVKKFSDPNAKDKKDVVVLDVMGKLKSLYAIASLVFIGKSLKTGGGQNILEPAALGKPVFVGPNNQNFQDIVDLFLSENAIVCVKDEDELLSKMRYFLENPLEASRLGASAKSVLEKQKGASWKTAQVITKVIADRT